MLDKSEMDQVILATGGYDHTIKLWQTHSGICYRTMQHTESQVNALEITPDRQLLASATYQHIFMYDLNSNNPNAIVNYEVPSKNITDIGFQIDGRWMYSGGEDCRVRLWDLKSKSTQCPKMFEIQTPVNCVCLHPNQVELFVGDLSGIIHKWDLKTDHNEQIIYGTTPEKDTMIVDVAIDPTGSMMAAVNNRGQCFVWHLTTGHMMDEPTKLEQSQTFLAHNRHGLCCEFSPDSKYLITTSADQTAKIWETTQFELVQELKQDGQRWVWDAAFSSDSQYVFTASSDGYAKLWNIETGNVEKEYAGHQKAVTALAFKDCAV